VAIAFLFAGQGAQEVGMGKDLAEADPEIRALYARASEAAGRDLARVSFEGPEDALTRTDVSQPAIVLASLAALAALRKRRPGLRPDFCAGLSLGEYSALAAAGAIDEIEAVKLVALRGRFMQEACDARRGAMASVLGAAPADAEAACREVSRPEEPVVVSNYNSPKQVVISGAEGGVAAAAELLKARGAKRVIPLKVAGAYHSPLMQSAAEKLAPHLMAAAIRAPAVTVLANITGDPYTTADSVREGLAHQVQSPVRWTETMERLLAAGVREVYELGPGGVLAGLFRQVSREAKVVSLMCAKDFEELPA
jgi:[acyl-carrier-protein] S-malonyltransferase